MSIRWSQLTFKLNNGLEIPAIGLGASDFTPDDARNVVQTALTAGYRHIDTAQACGNETAVGDGVMLSCVPRESLFLTTEINNMNHKRVAEAMEESLLKLHTDYVDLVLMHLPVSIDPTSEKPTVVSNDWTFIDTWREMEKLVESGKARSIGVSNFGIQDLETLLASARIVPAVCRVESDLNCPSTRLVEFCQSKGIHVTVYSSLGSNGSPLADNGTLQAIARARNATIQQILLVWALKRGTSVIPKSVTTSLIRSKLDLDGIDLTCYEMHLLTAFLIGPRSATWDEWLPEKLFSSDKQGPVLV